MEKAIDSRVHFLQEKEMQDVLFGSEQRETFSGRCMHNILKQLHNVQIYPINIDSVYNNQNKTEQIICNSNNPVVI